MPEVVDYDLPLQGTFHNLAIVSIRGPSRATPARWCTISGTGLLSLTKGVVVVDECVDVHDCGQVIRQSARTSTRRATPSWPRALSTTSTTRRRSSSTSGELGIDATAKDPAGDLRGWPDMIEMTPEVRDQVTRRWAGFGISVTKADARGPR